MGDGPQVRASGRSGGPQCTLDPAQPAPDAARDVARGVGRASVSSGEEKESVSHRPRARQRTLFRDSTIRHVDRAIASGSLPSIYCPCDPGRFPTPEQAKHVPQWHELRDWSLRAGNEGGARPPWASPIPKISTADAGTAEASPAPPTPVLRVSRLKSKPFGGRGYTSQFRGVHQTMPTGRWEAQFRRQGRPTSLGCFDSEEDAARAYDQMMIWIHLREPSKALNINFDLDNYAGQIEYLRGVAQDDLLDELRKLGRLQAEVTKGRRHTDRKRGRGGGGRKDEGAGFGESQGGGGGDAQDGAREATWAKGGAAGAGEGWSHEGQQEAVRDGVWARGGAAGTAEAWGHDGPPRRWDPSLAPTSVAFVEAMADAGLGGFGTGAGDPGWEPQRIREAWMAPARGAAASGPFLSRGMVALAPPGSGPPPLMALPSPLFFLPAMTGLPGGSWPPALMPQPLQPGLPGFVGGLLGGSVSVSSPPPLLPGRGMPAAAARGMGTGVPANWEALRGPTS